MIALHISIYFLVLLGVVTIFFNREKKLKKELHSVKQEKVNLLLENGRSKFFNSTNIKLYISYGKCKICRGFDTIW